MSTNKEPVRLKSQTLKANKVPYVRPKQNNGAESTPKKGNKNQTQRPSTPKSKAATEKAIRNDSRFQTYGTMDLEQLRKAKTEAIEDFDFDEDEYIEQVLRLHIDTSAQDASALGSQWMKERVEELLNTYFEHYNKLKQDFKNKEIEIRERESETFGKTRERHLLEIEEIETERVVQLKLDEESIPGESIILQKQARILAKANDFDGARASHQKAEDIRISNVERRQSETNTKFDRELKKLLDSQENQLQILQTRLLQSIADNESQLNEAILALQRESSVFIKSQLQKLIVDGCKTLHTTEQKNLFTSELTSTYQKDVKNLEKEHQLSLPFLYF